MDAKRRLAKSTVDVKGISPFNSFSKPILETTNSTTFSGCPLGFVGPVGFTSRFDHQFPLPMQESAEMNQVDRADGVYSASPSPRSPRKLIYQTRAETHMRLKSPSAAVAIFFTMVASTLASAESTSQPSSAIAPHMSSAEYHVALFELDHLADRRSFRRIGQQLSKSKDPALEDLTKAIGGSGKAWVLASSSLTSVERESASVFSLKSADALPIQVGPLADGVTNRGTVGFKIVIVPVEIEKARNRVDTAMQIQQSVLDGARNIVTTDVRDRAAVAPGEVYILSWVAAGKQYALTVMLDHYKKI